MAFFDANKNGRIRINLIVPDILLSSDLVADNQIKVCRLSKLRDAVDRIEM